MVVQSGRTSRVQYLRPKERPLPLPGDSAPFPNVSGGNVKVDEDLYLGVG